MRQRSRHVVLGVILVAVACDPAPVPTSAERPNRSSGSGSGGSGGGTTAAQIVVSTASLSGTTLAVRGSGAAPGASIAIDERRLGTASSTGTFSITNTSWVFAGCSVTVSDGRTSTVATLSPCSPPGSTPSAPGANVPTPVSPAAGSTVTQPGTIAWLAPASTPTPVDGYNWEISTSSSFASVVLQNSTNAPTTQDTFSGLPAGSYFWRVQAVEHGTTIAGQVQDPWSAPVSFTVGGSASGTPSTPTMSFPPAGAVYHPFESFYPRWSAATGAAEYLIEYSADAAFTPVLNQVTKTVPATNSRDSIRFGNPDTTWVRVRGVSATGVRGAPSNALRFIISYSAPIGPAPTLVSPAAGAQGLQLPITFRWNDVVNPQLEGYTLQIARDDKFTGDCAGIEFCNMLITGTSYTVTGVNSGFTLPRGRHFWRVQSIQGDRSPTLPALTAWSVVRSFDVP